MLVYAASLAAAVNVFSLEVFSDIIAKTSNLALRECSPLIGQIIAACLTVFVLPTLSSQQYKPLDVAASSKDPDESLVSKTFAGQRMVKYIFIAHLQFPLH